MKYPWGRVRAEKLGLVALNETAELLGVSTRTVEMWQSKGKMPAREKISRAFCYSRAEIMSLRETLERGERGQKTE